MAKVCCACSLDSGLGSGMCTISQHTSITLLQHCCSAAPANIRHLTYLLEELRTASATHCRTIVICAVCRASGCLTSLPACPCPAWPCHASCSCSHCVPRGSLPGHCFRHWRVVRSNPRAAAVHSRVRPVQLQLLGPLQVRSQGQRLQQGHGHREM
jgi:hypothetical protein